MKLDLALITQYTEFIYVWVIVMTLKKPFMVGLLILGLLAVWYALSSKVKDIIVGHEQQLEYRSLSITKSVLSTGAVPNAWSGGMYLSEGVLNNIFENLNGTKFHVSKPKEPNFWDLEITKAKTTLLPGEGEAELGMDARHNGSGPTLHMDVSGMLLPQDVVKTDDGEYVMHLGIVPIQVRVGAREGWFAISTGDVISELVTSGALLFAASKLKVDVKLPHDPEFKLAIDTQSDVPLPVPKDEGKMTLRFTMAGAKLTERMNYSPPIFINGGVWILGQRSDDGQRTILPPDVASTEDLGAQIGSMRAFLEPALKALERRDDVALWVHQDTIQGLIRKLNSLPQAQRTISVASTAVNGKFYEDKWRDDTLGEGGIFVEPTGPEAVHASAGLNAQSTWDKASGLKLTVGLAADATVDVHVHVDPLIGGGAGTTVGLKGRAADSLLGHVKIGKETAGDISAFVAVPTLQCKSVPVEVKTDGVLKIGSGWAEVPSIGLKVSELIGDKPLSPTVLLSSIPVYIPTPPSVSETKDSVVRSVPPHKGYDVTITPLGVDQNEDGYLLSAKAATAGNDNQDVQTARKELQDKFAREIAKIPSGAENKCPEKGVTEVLIGNLKFGPHNEVIKTFIKALEIAGRATDEMRKIATNPSQALKDAPDNTKKELNKGWEHLGLPGRL